MKLNLELWVSTWLLGALLVIALSALIDQIQSAKDRARFHHHVQRCRLCGVWFERQEQHRNIEFCSHCGAKNFSRRNGQLG